MSDIMKRLNNISVKDILSSQIGETSSGVTKRLNNISMEDILSSRIGETSSSIRATFKKTVNIAQYESEQYEISTTIELDSTVTGVQRAIIGEILQAQIEYAGYVHMMANGFITPAKFAERKYQLENMVLSLYNKAYDLGFGDEIAKYFEKEDTASDTIPPVTPQ